MDRFEAETYREILGPDGEKITLKEWIAAQINSSWAYSAHWKDGTWVQQAKDDCLARIDYAKKDLESLYKTLAEIEKIENT